MRHDVTFPLYVEVDEIYNLACPASPDPLPVRPGADDQDQRARRDQHAGPGQAREGAHPAGLDQRGLRRPGGAPAARGLLGQRQPDRHRGPATTKASAAPRRCSSTTTASTGCASRWRASSTPTARACTPNDGRVVSNFIVQALQGEGHHALRRRPADAQLLLCRRPDRRAVRLMDTDDGFTGPVNLGNPRQLGDQEGEIVPWRAASPSMPQWSNEPEDIAWHLDQALHLAFRPPRAGLAGHSDRRAERAIDPERLRRFGRPRYRSIRRSRPSIRAPAASPAAGDPGRHRRARGPRRRRIRTRDPPPRHPRHHRLDARPDRRRRPAVLRPARHASAPAPATSPCRTPTCCWSSAAASTSARSATTGRPSRRAPSRSRSTSTRPNWPSPR
jgi:hypothetical protein